MLSLASVQILAVGAILLLAVGLLRSQSSSKDLRLLLAMALEPPFPTVAVRQ